MKETNSEQETLALARALGKHLRPGDWIALEGELGSGKTVFVQGLGEALHCQEPPRSPTFALIHHYAPKPGAGRFPLRHVDLYRLSGKEVPLLDWEDLLDDKGVTVVEWAEKAKAFWPANGLPIVAAHAGEERRSFSFFAGGPRAAELIKKLKGEKI